MSNVVIAGRLGAREMPMRSVWRRIGGSEYERRWWGLAKDVAALQPSLKSDALISSITFDQNPGSPIAILTATYSSLPGTQLTSEEMTIEFAEEVFPINQNPTFIGIDSSLIRLIHKEVTGEKTNDYPPGGLTYRYFELLSRDVTNYHVSLPVVTWTRVVGAHYAAEFDLEDVGKIFTTRALVDSLGSPAIWSIPMGNAGVPEDAGTMFQFGWRKTGSAGYTADGQIVLTLRATYGHWAKDLYEFIPPLA